MLRKKEPKVTLEFGVGTTSWAEASLPVAADEREKGRGSGEKRPAGVCVEFETPGEERGEMPNRRLDNQV